MQLEQPVAACAEYIPGVQAPHVLAETAPETADAVPAAQFVHPDNPSTSA
jgi:hypothetical protein